MTSKSGIVLLITPAILIFNLSLTSYNGVPNDIARAACPKAEAILSDYICKMKLFDQLSSGKGLFFLIGPCAVETEEVMDAVALKIAKLRDKTGATFVLKASYKKANRSRLDSFTGIGNQKAIDLLLETGKKYNLPTITDIHTAEEASWAAGYVDILQIPAFLCRQTDLLVAAAKTGKIINIKKGQFLSPEGMQFAADKVSSSGNSKILLTERGTSFGYSDLIVDMRSFPIMKKIGFPTVIDATHALQQPNQSTGVTGGRPELIRTIASSAIASGADGVFIETHPNPSEALSDGANMLPLEELEELVIRLLKIKEAIG